jgi:uncharacterized protein
MTTFDIPIAFALGLVSSLHCSQMCGPIVLSYGIGGGAGTAAHLSYNLGRVLTYSLLGAVAGSAGHALIRIAGIEQTAAIVSGVVMVAAGVLMSGAVRSSRLIQIGVTPSFSRFAGKLILAQGPARKLALGLVMGFLPCGLLYAALLKAASTGSAFGGAASMAAFGIGTSGALLAIGLFSSALRVRLGGWTNRLAAASIVVLGIVLVVRGVLATIPSISCHG